MSISMSATTLRRLIVICLIALWEMLPRAGLIPELFLPSLSSTITAGWNDAGEYGHALAVTLYEIAISMVFACGGGILAGAIVGSAIANSYGPAYAVQPGYAAYPGYAAAGPVACPGGYWARRPVAFDAYGNPIGWSRPRFFCP